MNVWRILAAWFLGVLTVALVLLAWLVVFAIGAFMFSDCSGGWMWTCRTDLNNTLGFMVWTALATAAAGVGMFTSVRGLGRWATGSVEGRGPTVTAAVVTAVFAVAAVVFSLDVRSDLYAP